MQELAKARAISATTLATYNALVADAERARLDAVLAAGTAHATAAELQRTVALDRVVLSKNKLQSQQCRGRSRGKSDSRCIGKHSRHRSTNRYQSAPAAAASRTNW